MVSLNTLRTKFGAVLSIVIGIALIAFIVSLKADMGFSGNDPEVGVVDGEAVTYSEYFGEYERVKAQSGASESNDQQAEMLANATWQAIIAQIVLEPGFEDAGLMITEQERVAIISGEQATQAMYNAFADPATGSYNVMAVNQFLSQLENTSTPQEQARLQQIWASLIEQATMERMANKYMGLVRNGAFVNTLEVENALNASNNTFNGRWISKKYSDVADSLINVTNSDIKKYYKDHKEMFQQMPNRTLSYVVFDVEPTDEDLVELENKAIEMGNGFAVAENIKSFARASRRGNIAENYVKYSSLSDDEAAALSNGQMYGPVLKNNEWKMTRVLDSKMASDSVGVKHIVLSYTDTKLADSLVTLLENGGNIAELAAKYSVYEQTANNGGDVGVIPFAGFTGEFADALAGVKKGDVVKIVSGDAIQIMEIYKADKPSRHVQLASIVLPVEASAATVRNIHSAAGTFTVDAKGSLENFNAGALAAAVTPRVAILTQGERTIRGLEDSREIARWAYAAEVGDISEVFKVGKDYVVGVLTTVDDDKYSSLGKVTAQIRAQLIRDNKFDILSKEVSGATFEEQAKSLNTEVADFTNVDYNSFYIDGIGVEPRLIGAISASEKGAISAPVKGGSGLYVFVVDEIITNDKQTVDAERVRAQATIENMVQQISFGAIQQMAKIEDLRGQYM